ncbi:MAG TPA: hypothetical protein VGS57_13400 [Thermoanaerobaculia bacterium]|nr:hypothetical protein [Thermoanaerobaculia bacterium]
MPAGATLNWYTYRLADHVVQANFELVELEPGWEGGPEIRCELLPPIVEHAEPREWFHGWRLPGDGSWWMQAAEADGEYLLRFPGLLDARVSADGTRVRCLPLHGTPMETVRHLLLDQVLPLAIGLGGDLVLHAAALAVQGQAVAILGPTGSGKSTLAAWLGRHGCTLLTDDCLVVREGAGEWCALPYYGGFRLWPDNLAALLPGETAVAGMAHYSRKQRVVEPEGWRAAAVARPLRHLCFLQPAPEPADSGEVTIDPLPPREAMMSLVRASFLLEIRSPHVLARQFDAIGRLVDAVPSAALRYPRVHAALADVHDAIRTRLLVDEAAGVSRCAPEDPPARDR